MFKRLTTLLTVLLGALIGLTACAPEDEPEGIGIIYGARANSAILHPAVFEQFLPEAPAPGSVVSVVAVSGSAAGDVIAELTVNPSLDSRTRKENYQSDLTLLSTLLQSYQAQSSEADLVAAIGATVRKLSHIEGNKTLIIADSMIATSGLLDFQKVSLNASPEDVAEALLNTGLLPDLSGYTVIVFGLGETVAPQAELQDRSNLEAIWRAVFEVSGTTNVTFRYDGMRIQTADRDFLLVTPVPVTTQSIELGACSAALPESVVRFLPDQAVFVDPQAARNAISRVGQAISDCPGQIEVIGTTSSAGTEQSRHSVSTQRAEAVRNELATLLNISPTQISARGVGMNFPEYILDRNNQGQLVPELAIQNRNVFIKVTEH